MATSSSQSAVLDRVGKSGAELRVEERRPAVHMIDLGRARNRIVKDLKDGRGPLLGDIADAIEQVEATLGSEAAGKTILPIVVIVEKRRKRGDMSAMPSPFRMMMP